MSDIIDKVIGTAYLSRKHKHKWEYYATEGSHSGYITQWYRCSCGARKKVNVWSLWGRPSVYGSAWIIYPDGTRKQVRPYATVQGTRF
jgi:hypothetical protein